jgi:hypothetical protein
LLNSPYHLIEPLITDNDQPIHRQLLMKLLAPLGFEIKEASNGKDAIAALEPFASRVRSTQAIVLVRGTPFNMDRRRKNILNLREKVILPWRSCEPRVCEKNQTRSGFRPGVMSLSVNPLNKL